MYWCFLAYDEQDAKPIDFLLIETQQFSLLNDRRYAPPTILFSNYDVPND